LGLGRSTHAATFSILSPEGASPEVPPNQSVRKKQKNHSSKIAQEHKT